MKVPTLILTLVAAVLSTYTAAGVDGAPFLGKTEAKAIANSYIVVLNSNVTVTTFATTIQNTLARHNAAARSPFNRIEATHEFVRAISVTLNAASLKEILAMPGVAYVEQDAVVTIQVSQASPPSWGLTRVSEKNLLLPGPYLYKDAAGSGVTVYVIDTGINTAHTDFQGRATNGVSLVAGSTTDDNGHGTHVAATIGGLTYGVAKKVKLVGVKVLDSTGSGSLSNVLSGINWVLSNNAGKKAVVNMSLGAPRSQVVNDAADQLYLKGILLVAAAGNSNADACQYSPAGSNYTYAVGASDKTDRTASFSNWGTCVDIIAPGVDITSAWIGSTTAKNTITGTSMSSPHVAGAAAYYLSLQAAATVPPATVANWLTTNATPNKLAAVIGATPNKLLYNGGA